MRLAIQLIVLAMLLRGSSQLHAAEVVVDDRTNMYRPVARNEPDLQDVWAGLSQSFIAEDPHIVFGFRMLDVSPLLPDKGKPLIYNLYQGEDSYSTLLASRTVAFPSTVSADSRAAFGDVGFVDADFSNVALGVGLKYTVEITVPTANLPVTGRDSGFGVWTSSANPYSDGRFFFRTGYDNSLFSSNDMLFRISPVPEPSTLVIAILGFLGFAARGCRRRSTP